MSIKLFPDASAFERDMASLNTRPATPVEGLETVKPLWGTEQAQISLPNDEYVTRSQAEAIIAAERAENTTLKAGIKRLSDEQELLSETTDGDIISVVKLAARLSEAEADNAALTSRVKELEHDLNGAKGNAKNASSNCIYWRGQTEALETQLAAASKALERIKNMSREDGPWDQIAHDMQQIACSAVMAVKK